MGECHFRKINDVKCAVDRQDLTCSFGSPYCGVLDALIAFYAYVRVLMCSVCIRTR